MDLKTINWFSAISYYYSKGMYTNEDVKQFVIAGKISESDYQKITGEIYV